MFFFELLENNFFLYSLLNDPAEAIPLMLLKPFHEFDEHFSKLVVVSDVI